MRRLLQTCGIRAVHADNVKDGRPNLFDVGGKSEWRIGHVLREFLSPAVRLPGACLSRLERTPARGRCGPADGRGKTAGFLFGVVAVIVALASSTCAQESKIDSLLNALNKQPRDSNTVHALIALSTAYRDREPQKAIDYARQAETLAASAGSGSLQARASVGLGQALVRARQNTEARETLERGWHLAEVNNDGFAKVTALHELGSLSETQGKTDEALSLYANGLDAAERLKDRMHMGIFCNSIGCLLMNQGKDERAEEYLQRGLRIREDLGDDAGAAGTLINIGLLYKRRSDYNHALEYYQHGLRISERIGHKQWMANALNNMALVYKEQGRYTLALECYQRCLRLNEELGSRQRMASPLNNIALLYKEQEKYDLALEYYDRTLKLDKEFDNKEGIAYDYMGMGHIYFAQKKYDTALVYYQRCKALSTDLKANRILAGSLLSIGKVLLAWSRYDEAADSFLRSIQINTSAGNRRDVALALINLGNIEYQRGNYDSAIARVSQSYAIAREIGAISMLKDACEQLSAAHEMKGDVATAFRYFKEYSTLRDSLARAANNKSIAEMTAQYEGEKKEQQISLLEKDKLLLSKDKALQASELEQQARELRIQHFESERIRHRAELLARERDLKSMELDKRSVDLELRTRDLENQKREKERARKEKEYQAGIAVREMSLRNGLIGGILLVLMVGMLAIKRIQSKRTEASLRAEAAEYKAKATEAQTLAMQASSERREKLAQRQFTKRLIDTQESERKRIAGALHDSLGQDLLVIKNRALFALQSGSISKEAQVEFEQIVDLTTSALDNVRHISHELRPYQLDRLGLTKTIRSAILKISEQTAIHFAHQIDNIDDLLSKEDETNVYRIVQESVNNILKHSGATEASVVILRQPERITIRVEDNGQGLKETGAAREKQGFGVQNMRERTQILGGVLTLTTLPAGGTRVEIDLPVQGDRMDRV